MPKELMSLVLLTSPNGWRGAREPPVLSRQVERRLQKLGVLERAVLLRRIPLGGTQQEYLVYRLTPRASE